MCQYQSHAIIPYFTACTIINKCSFTRGGGIYNEQRQENCAKGNLNGLLSVVRARKVVHTNAFLGTKLTQ